MWGGIPPKLRNLVLRPPTSYALVGATAVLLAVDLTSVHRTGDEVALVYRTVPAVLLAVTVGIAVLRARAGLDSALDRRFVLVCCAVVLGLASIGPVRGSQDLWAYAMYGRVSSVHHADPY